MEALTVKLKAAEALVQEREEEVKRLSVEMESLKADNDRSEERRVEFEGIVDQLREKHVSCLLRRCNEMEVDVSSMAELEWLIQISSAMHLYSNYRRRLTAIPVGGVLCNGGSNVPTPSTYTLRCFRLFQGHDCAV